MRNLFFIALAGLFMAPVLFTEMKARDVVYPSGFSVSLQNGMNMDFDVYGDTKVMVYFRNDGTRSTGGIYWD